MPIGSDKGNFIKPGFDPLAAQTSVTSYYLYVWGENSQGELGIGTSGSGVNKSAPVQIDAVGNWVNYWSGYTFSGSVKIDGSLWTWGANNYGQLGNGNTAATSSPGQVGPLTNWLEAAAGYYHTVASKPDGSIWTWGYNAQSQLGTGNNTNYSSPVQIGALTDWSKTAAGGYHVLSVKSDGTLWSWGLNNFGQLGTNSGVAQTNSPVQIGALTTWAEVGVAAFGSAAIKTDGTLWTWGQGSTGSLGTGSNANTSSPVQVGSLTTWSTISGGSGTMFAIKTDGTLWAWGNNSYGQLGGGNNTSGNSSPVQVGALTTWSAISQGANHITCLKTDGTLWAWGLNNSGQLGDGSTTVRYSPVQIGSLTTWKHTPGKNSTPTSKSSFGLLD